MTDLLQKCTVCGALVDAEDLFCANCGTEAPRDEGAVESLPSTTATHAFECGGCGASMSYDASAGTLRCPFCGSEKLDRKADAKVLSPTRIVPFSVERDAAVDIMRRWLGRGWLRPGNLATHAAVHRIAPVFVPYWIFRAATHSYWTADTSRTPAGARGDWFPMAGEHRGSYSGILIGASGALTPSETWSISPFDLSAGVAPAHVDLENAIVEKFRVSRKYARPLARRDLEEAERRACDARYVPGRSRNVKANLRIENLAGEPVLLPVWIVAYRYEGRLFRFLVNGQSGKAAGQAPTSWRKILAIAGGVVGLAAAIALMTLIAASM